MPTSDASDRPDTPPDAEPSAACPAEAGPSDAEQLASGAPPAEDELLPMRSVNAHTFCKRLFWLEERAGLFEPNEHTVAGERAHRRVTAPGGKVAPPAAESPAAEPVRTGVAGATANESTPEAWHARSLWLSSPAVGVSGKLDVVEVDAETGRALCVDTKKGRSRDGELWPADEVQLVLQALLLREAGYEVEEVAAFYKSEQRRVRVPLTDAMIGRARDQVASARRTLALAAPPPPLVGSNKCGGCSLNAICQPDEVSALTGRASWAPGEAIRRVVPASDDARPLYVTEPGSRLSARGRSLLVQPRRDSDADKVAAGLAKTSHVVIVGGAQVTSQALHLCLQAGRPVCFMSSSGRLAGVAEGADSRAAHVRLAQARHHDGEVGLRIARVLVADKIANQRTVLRRNATPDELDDGTRARLKRLSDDALEAADRPRLLAMEGEAAKRHWQVFSSLCARDDDAFAMRGRTRRPPRDRTNALISFASALLTKDCHLAVRLAGLDPYIGVFHTVHHGRPSLALDLMEPFRPLVVDSVVLGLIRREELRPADFVFAGQQVSLRKDARRTLIAAYERRLTDPITHPLFGYRISYRQTLSVQARLLARVLTAELDAMPPFRTR